MAFSSRCVAPRQNFESVKIIGVLAFRELPRKIGVFRHPVACELEPALCNIIACAKCSGKL
jgi:hypothetical protein